MVMAVDMIQFQPSMNLTELYEQYGTKQQCELALETARWRAKHKLMQVEIERESGRGSENKLPFVAAV
jgi:hypothetical protein